MTARQDAQPGRAGRLRLRHSLDVATRGAALLERKLHVLRDHHERLTAREEAARDAWREALAEAESWLLRGLLLGGERALEKAAVAARAEVTVTWTTSMGVRHPADAGVRDAPRGAHEADPANTALAHAEAAFRTAVRAAAACAVARTAAHLVGAELDRTRHRLRALDHHWIPRLTARLADAELALEQAEHEDAVRRRRAGAHRR
ncbi:V-type ATP synthase subunit D [Streptomyces sp. HPF1205]|uniref:V-type ATP synthase subunit D n=1 Tax=Streptomyces sp. HPF1205 TaxID=2873262 RepID=UPI001CED2C88|nr:V-type ATP synthase subunit D [Streptomyces sp. HPF1205]